MVAMCTADRSADHWGRWNTIIGGHTGEGFVTKKSIMACFGLGDQGLRFLTVSTGSDGMAWLGLEEVTGGRLSGGDKNAHNAHSLGKQQNKTATQTPEKNCKRKFDFNMMTVEIMQAITRVRKKFMTAWRAF